MRICFSGGGRCLSRLLETTAPSAAARAGPQVFPRRASRFRPKLPIADGKESSARMRVCACCGRQLPWLHRVKGTLRYCSAECARRHPEIVAGALTLSPVAAGVETTGKEPGEDPWDGPGGQDPDVAVWLVEGPRGSASAGLEPALPEGEAPVWLTASQNADTETGPGPRHSQRAEPRAEMPADPRPAPWLPLTATPAAASQTVSAHAVPLRPRRRIIVPAHRPAMTDAAPRWHNVLLPSRPVQGGGVDPLEHVKRTPGPRPRVGVPGAAAGSPPPVLVMSFDGDTALPLTLSGLPPGQAGGAAAAARCAHADPLEFVPAPPHIPLRPDAALRSRRLPGPVPRQPGLAAPDPAPCPPVYCRAVTDLEQQAAAVQPFRLHRMPLRPLRVAPRGLPKQAPPQAPDPIRRPAFGATVHVPRVKALPMRPTYCLSPSPAGTAGDRPPAVNPAPAARLLTGGDVP